MRVPPEILAFFRNEDNFFIATHINPEGDALGSSLALFMAFESLGKNSIVYDLDPVPDFYRFLPKSELFIQSASGLQTSSLNLILIDCNTPDRAGLDGIPFKSSVVIDHHETEADFGSLKWIVPDAAATGIMVFCILKELGIRITGEMALNLYTALAIDTGTFRYGNTSAEVLRIAAELIDAGANPALVSRGLYESWSQNRFQLLIMALDTLDIREGVAFIHVTQEMLRQTGTGAEDTENFPGFPRMMNDIRISAFFREIGDDHWKVSLRSKGDVNVARIAIRFGGGGHKNAAGYRIRASLESAKKSLIDPI